MINGIGALLSLLVLVIVTVVKFREGAWVIIVLVPIMVYGVVRLNRTYEAEDVELARGRPGAGRGAHHAHARVVVLVDNLDAATARAIQYARTLQPDDLRAVHFDLDSWQTEPADRGVGRSRLHPLPARHRRVPRPADAARRARARRRRRRPTATPN